MRYLIPTLIFFLLNLNQFFACDCLESGDVKTEVKRASLVAVVKTISQDTIKFTNEYGRVDYKWEYRLLVLRKLKGKTTSDTIIVSTPYGETACGYFFKINHEYILYGTQWAIVKRKAVLLPENYFQTTSCTRTKEVEPKEEAMIKAVAEE